MFRRIAELKFTRSASCSEMLYTTKQVVRIEIVADEDNLFWSKNAHPLSPDRYERSQYLVHAEMRCEDHEQSERYRTGIPGVNKGVRISLMCCWLFSYD